MTLAEVRSRANFLHDVSTRRSEVDARKGKNELEEGKMDMAHRHRFQHFSEDRQTVLRPAADTFPILTWQDLRAFNLLPGIAESFLEIVIIVWVALTVWCCAGGAARRVKHTHGQKGFLTQLTEWEG